MIPRCALKNRWEFDWQTQGRCFRQRGREDWRVRTPGLPVAPASGSRCQRFQTAGVFLRFTEAAHILTFHILFLRLECTAGPI